MSLVDNDERKQSFSETGADLRPELRSFLAAVRGNSESARHFPNERAIAVVLRAGDENAAVHSVPHKPIETDVAFAHPRQADDLHRRQKFLRHVQTFARDLGRRGGDQVGQIRFEFFPFSLHATDEFVQQLRLAVGIGERGANVRLRQIELVAQRIGGEILQARVIVQPDHRLAFALAPDPADARNHVQSDLDPAQFAIGEKTFRRGFRAGCVLGITSVHKDFASSNCKSTVAHAFSNSRWISSAPRSFASWDVVVKRVATSSIASTRLMTSSLSSSDSGLDGPIISALTNSRGFSPGRSEWLNESIISRPNCSASLTSKTSGLSYSSDHSFRPLEILILNFILRVLRFLLWNFRRDTRRNLIQPSEFPQKKTK